MSFRHCVSAAPVRMLSICRQMLREPQGDILDLAPVLCNETIHRSLQESSQHLYTGKHKRAARSLEIAQRVVLIEASSVSLLGYLTYLVVELEVVVMGEAGFV